MYLSLIKSNEQDVSICHYFLKFFDTCPGGIQMARLKKLSSLRAVHSSIHFSDIRIFREALTGQSVLHKSMNRQ